MGDGEHGPGAGRDRVTERLRTLLPVVSAHDHLDVEELEGRRRQLFLVAAFAAFGAAAIAAATLLFDGVDLPPWVGLALMATTAVFFFDATMQERALREVTRRAVAERSRSIELAEALDHLAALQSIARRVNAVLLPEEIYEVVLEGAVELLDGERGSIRLRVDDTLTVAASTGPGAPPIGESVSLLRDPESPVVTIGITQREDAPARLAVPVQVGQRIVGVLSVAREHGAPAFTDRLELVATLFADVAATAFVNANRFDHERLRAEVAVTASEHRSDAVADTVHDLRAPLAGLVGFAQLLRDRYDALDAEQRRAAVVDVHDQAMELDDRIQHIFEAASAEAQATRVREPVEMAAVAADGIATARAAADHVGRAHRVTLDVSGDVVAIGDPDALRRVVTNLVGNALEHAGPDVLVRLQRRAGEVRLHVADRGGGIDSDELEQLFCRRRAPVGEPRGRGLPIVDLLVRAMGGRVGVRSQPGVGSVFSVMLPARR